MVRSNLPEGRPRFDPKASRWGLVERRFDPKASRWGPVASKVLRVIEFWVVVVALGLFMRAFRKEVHGRALLEAGVLVCIITTFAFLPPVRSLFRKLPKLHRAIVISVVGLAIVAQLASRVYYTFPFVAWTMYSLPPETADAASHYEFLGLGEDGAPRRVIPGDVIPGHMRMYVKLSRLIALATQSGATDAERTTLDETLRGLGRAYNVSRPPAGPIRSIEVRQCRFRLDEYRDLALSGAAPPWNEALLGREIVWRVDVGT